MRNKPRCLWIEAIRIRNQMEIYWQEKQAEAEEILENTNKVEKNPTG